MYSSIWRARNGDRLPRQSSLDSGSAEDACSQLHPLTQWAADFSTPSDDDDRAAAAAYSDSTGFIDQVGFEGTLRPSNQLKCFPRSTYKVTLITTLFCNPTSVIIFTYLFLQLYILNAEKVNIIISYNYISLSA